MRKIPLLALALAASPFFAYADPATPTPDPFAQPAHGNEVRPYTQLENELRTQLRANDPLKDKEALILHRIGGLNTEYPNLKDYQILETDDGRLLITMRMADGRSVFYDPQKDEMVEMDPATPDKVI